MEGFSEDEIKKRNEMREKMNSMSQEERIELQVKEATRLFEILTYNEDIKRLSHEERWKLLCEAQPEFTRCYPIICINMLEGKFHPKVFELWLQRLEKDPGKGMEGYCERQADYAKMLFRKYNKRAPEKHAKAVWKHTFDMMRNEQKNMEEAEKNASEKQKEERAKFDEELRNELYEYLLSCKKSNS